MLEKYDERDRIQEREIKNSDPLAAENFYMKKDIDLLMERLRQHDDHEFVDSLLNREQRFPDSQGSIINMGGGESPDFHR